ncbi:hypothetical protein [Streptomyces sp. NBC_00986]|uniref:hypothetical protein n=1 Tax=Streptomyces sp. NBC_00986 TaxID=2903702 RepID=UPI00386D0636|nr:hypothetical protein OG504_45100 [Streptomyces sp. NBC_00986]
MIITYKPGDDLPEERYFTDELSAIEAAAIEEATNGTAWRRIEDLLRAQDPTSLRAVLWAFRRRTQPGLVFSEFDVPGWKRRLFARIERVEIDDVLNTLVTEALANNEDAAIDSMLPHLRRLAHDQADVEAALDALGKGHLAAGPED